MEGSKKENDMNTATNILAVAPNHSPNQEVLIPRTSFLGFVMVGSGGDCESSFQTPCNPPVGVRQSKATERMGILARFFFHLGAKAQEYSGEGSPADAGVIF
jgi:hypothetical protein